MDYKLLFQDKIVSTSLLLSLLFFLIALGFVLLTFPHLGPFLPLYNQMSWGEPRIANKLNLFIPLGLPIVIFFGNFFFASAFYASLPLIARILFVTTALTTFLIMLFLIGTIILVL